MSIKVVVTGLGVIAPNGIGKDKYWEAIVTGESGIKRITTFDTSQYPVKIAGEINDFQVTDYIDKKKARLASRFSQFALVSTMMAIEDAKLKIENEDCYRLGVSMGTAIGGNKVAEEQVNIYYKEGLSKINPFSFIEMNPNSAVGVITIEFGIKGPNITISTGCSAGLSAIGYAFDTIKNNRADVMIAGGTEAPLTPVAFGSFCAANVLTKRNGDPEKASRPFDKLRDGYVLCEGSGIVILEEMEHALKRGADIYAEIIGYGVTNDAYSMITMEPTGEEVAKTIGLALENAKVSPTDVDYINAHGSSSQISDKRETNAIKLALGEHAYKVPISSIKSMIGQGLAATASIQFVTTALAIKNNCFPPTINYEEPDPECDLDYVPNEVRNSKKINTALINSFGAGGNNISMVMKKYNNLQNIQSQNN